jgi:hypothetical protein
MFVRGIERGGLFIAIIQIDTSSSDDLERISEKFEVSYGSFSVEAKTNLQEILQEFKNTNFKMYMYTYHEGGPPNIYPDSNLDALIDACKYWLTSFKSDPLKYAVPLYATLDPITIVNGPITPNSDAILHAEFILTICAKERSRILDDLNLLKYILSNTSSYDFVAPTTPETIVKASAGFQADLDLVSATASLAMNNLAEAMYPAKYAEMTNQEYPHKLPDPLPTLKF